MPSICYYFISIRSNFLSRPCKKVTWLGSCQEIGGGMSKLLAGVVNPEVLTTKCTHKSLGEQIYFNMSMGGKIKI